MPPKPAPFHPRQFASDNYAGVCPEAWAALEEANRDHARGYGEDPWTARAADLIRAAFAAGRAAADADVFFVFNGTAANALSLASLCQSYHAVIVHESAHVETDECGAPEFFSNGTKLLLAGGDDAKLDPAEIDRLVLRRRDIHYPRPRVVSITQPTEFGTLYTLDELRAIGDAARRHGLAVHMDGARFGNAAAALDVTPREIIDAAGVDVLCFGGTKAGLAYGEAVVWFNRDLAREFDYRCKQAGQLASKMRFLAAPWVGLLGGGAWLRYARHANAMAHRLESRLREVDGVRLLRPQRVNSVFVALPPQQLQAMRARGWMLYDFIGAGARLMCAWDTTEGDVEAIVADLAAVVAGSSAGEP